MRKSNNAGLVSGSSSANCFPKRMTASTRSSWPKLKGLTIKLNSLGRSNLAAAPRRKTTEPSSGAKKMISPAEPNVFDMLAVLPSFSLVSCGGNLKAV